MVILGIKYLEVEPITSFIQEATARVSDEICPLAETSMDDIRAIPHGFKLSFSSLIMVLVVNENQVPLAKGTWVDVESLWDFD